MGHGLQHPQPGLGAKARLHLIDNGFAQHLIAAADPQQRHLALPGLLDRVRHAALAQPAQIAEGIFTARENDQVGVGQRLRIADIAHPDVWLRRQGVKVGKIGDMRQVNHGDVDVAPVGAMVFPGLQRDAVLILKIHVKPWHNAQHRHPGQRLDLLYPGAQERHIAAEFIDDHPFHARPLLRLQQRQRAVNRGKHPAAVDIGHQDHRALRHLGHAHIDDIAVAQVNLRRTAGAFQHQRLILSGQALVDREDLLAQAWLVLVIAHRIHAGRHLPHQHHLRLTVAGGLEQNRIHADIRRNPGRFGLENLRPAHLFAIRRNAGVQRHIL